MSMIDTLTPLPGGLGTAFEVQCYISYTVQELPDKYPVWIES